MLFDEVFLDINGRSHRRCSVREIGTAFSPFDRYTNAFILPNADLYPMTRAEAWDYLRTH